MKEVKSVLLWLTFFSIAMGFLESSVVVFLRELYYPEGFKFPLAPIAGHIATTEIIREAATIIMLIGAGVMAGRNRAERFACFIYAFAIWDIFYYVFLKLLLGWPESIMTWDILFLIPAPWVGPVIAPVLLSLSMILLAFVIYYVQDRGANARLQWQESTGLILASVIVVFSFILDYVEYMLERGTQGWAPGSGQAMFDEVGGYIPQNFHWGIFMTGQLLILLVIFNYVRIRLHRKVIA